MGKILAIDDDHATLILIEGALALAGHDTLITADHAVFNDILSTGPIDALILDINMPRISGFEILKRLREQPRWRTLPVLLISAETDGDVRARGLRDGADDFLAKPFVADELIASIERMMARQSSDTGLQGSLERFPAPELLQYLASGTKTGFLEIARRGRPAEILFRDGFVVAATAGNLTGREAILETLTLTEGFFHFEFDDRSSSTEPRIKIDLQSALFESAWLEDELEKRRESIPANDQPLVVLDHQFERLEDFEELPSPEIHRWISTRPGIRLEEILAENIACTVKTKLTVTLMVASGVVAFAPREDPVIFRNLLQGFASRSRDASLIHLLIVSSPTAWENLLKFLQEVPEKLLPTQSDHLFEQLRTRRRGTLRLSVSEYGSIIFHFLPLEAPLEVDQAVLETVAGVVLWPALARQEDTLPCLAELDDPNCALRSAAARILLAGDSLDAPLTEKHAPLWTRGKTNPESFEDFVNEMAPALQG